MRSLVDFISKVMRQIRSSKLWKAKSEKTREKYHQDLYTAELRRNPTKLHIKDRSFVNVQRTFKDFLNGVSRKRNTRIMSSCTDISFGWSEQICDTCKPEETSSCSSDGDDCLRCRVPITSQSAAYLDIAYLRSASHWQRYLSHSTSGWRRFNSDDKFCY